MKRLHLDANVVLRFLRDDDVKQSPAARRLIGEASEGKIVLALSAVTVGEIFYALGRLINCRGRRSCRCWTQWPAAGFLTSNMSGVCSTR